jgi:hypothetical protein
MRISYEERLKLEKQIQEIQNERSNLRSRERSLKERAAKISSMPLVSLGGPNLKANLAKILPKHLCPSNIGDYNEVMWPYWFPFNFDFGDDPTFDVNTFREATVQVDQEAGFLLTHISRDSFDKGPAGYNAPLQITIRDLQSSRQFNDEPIPLQQIGYRSLPTYLDTPLYFAPNARIQLIMSSWIPDGEEFETTGKGNQQLMIGGFRIRKKDASKVLASIFI